MPWHSQSVRGEVGSSPPHRCRCETLANWLDPPHRQRSCPPISERNFSFPSSHPSSTFTSQSVRCSVAARRASISASAASRRAARRRVGAHLPPFVFFPMSSQRSISLQPLLQPPPRVFPGRRPSLRRVLCRALGLGWLGPGAARPLSGPPAASGSAARWILDHHSPRPSLLLQPTRAWLPERQHLFLEARSSRCTYPPGRELKRSQMPHLLAPSRRP